MAYSWQSGFERALQLNRNAFFLSNGNTDGMDLTDFHRFIRNDL
jgi:hypothetical protein